MLSRSETVEQWLDGIVSENRFTIAVVFPLVGAVLFIASLEGWLPPVLSFNPYLILIGTVVMRLPLVAGLFPLRDRRLLAGLGIVILYAYAIEAIGIATGLPYGQFSYGIELGPMIGPIPLGLPLFFVPLLINSFLLAVLYRQERSVWWVVATAVVTLVVMDLVLDPAAVALGFWTYEASGGFYGVPLQNFAGWVLSASVTGVILGVSLRLDAVEHRLETCPYFLDDLVSFALLWGTINLYVGNLVPALLAVVFLGLLMRSGRFDTRLLD